MIDKIEIDSDNIETPPATRKLFSPPREVKPVEREPCKRERCNGFFQTRDFKNATGKSVNNNADFGTGKVINILWMPFLQISSQIEILVDYRFR